MLAPAVAEGGVLSPYPLHVSAAGSPSMWKGDKSREPVILLVGNATAHYGVIVGGPACRLVEDPKSPLRFAYVGDGVRAQGKRDPDVRWVTLHGESEGFAATVRALFGTNVRIEYQETAK